MQGKIPGWKVVEPPIASERTHQAGQIDRLCHSRAVPRKTSPAIALHRPEFSRWAQKLAIQAMARPRSGSQLYAQRLAALRHGQIYTRLPAHSFQNIWETATQHPQHEDWLKLLHYEAKAMADGQGSQRLNVLLGDSLAHRFPSEKLSRDRFWLNQGIPGDTTSGVLQRLSMLEQTNPDEIYLMVGINDLRQGKPHREILINLQQIIQRLKAAHPDARIYVASVLPTRLEAIPADRIRRLNTNIAHLTHQAGVHFFNLQPAFADQEGKLRVQLTTDGLHLNEHGYRVWQVAMSPIF
jgi:lysophospholipase L1-like esterase